MIRLCPDESFLSLCHRRTVTGLRMLYKVISNSNYCLFSEFPSASTRVRYSLAAAAAHPLEFDVSWCRTCQFVRYVSCRPMFDCGMTFHTPCLIPESWMGSREQSTDGFFPELLLLLSFKKIGNARPGERD